MHTYRFTLAFKGVDPWDDAQIELLADRLPHVHWGEVDGDVRATAFAEGATGVEAVLWTVASVQEACPTAEPVRVIEEFVEIDHALGLHEKYFNGKDNQ